MQQHDGNVQLHADIALGQSLHGDPNGKGREREHGDGVVRVDGGFSIVGRKPVGDAQPRGRGPGDDDLDDRGDGWIGKLHVCVGGSADGMQQFELGIDQLHAE
jgi:hypothetical protein